MIRLPFYQIDAFTNRVFSGNPAGVCPLEHWLPEEVMQAIAAENNLSETAFFVPDNDDYHLRWFTPRQEVDLCGHATLASAFVIFNELDPSRDKIRFRSKSGVLRVEKTEERMSMDFPALSRENCPKPPEALLAGLKKGWKELYSVAGDPHYLVVYESEAEVRSLRPDLHELAKLHPYCVLATAPGNKADCISRYFAPSYGIPEDPATGAAHCALTPYWANRLNKKKIYAQQISLYAGRNAEIFCEDRDERVYLTGRAKKYLEGTIETPD